MEVLLFPQPAEHIAHHRRCHQPQQPQSGNPCPLSIRLIAVLSGARLLETCLSDQRCCHCATLVPLPPLICRPICFANSLSLRLHLLLRYCAPLVQLIVLLPGGLPPPLSRRLCLSSRLPICWLMHHVASRCLVPWPSPPLSSHLRLSVCPSHLVGGCIVLPGALASLSARRIGLSSRSRLSLRHCAPLLTQCFYSTPALCRAIWHRKTIQIGTSMGGF
jgi:hypothetical protein